MSTNQRPRNCATEDRHPNIRIWGCQAKQCDSTEKNSEGVYKHPAGEKWVGKISRL